MSRVTLLSRERCRGAVAIGLALLVCGLGIPIAQAAGPDLPAIGLNAMAGTAATEGASSEPTPTPTPTPTPASGAVPAQAPAPAPRLQLQLQDEGPAAVDRDAMRLARRQAAVADAGERPFWKSWIFWTITGALVIGAVSLVAYTSSQTRTSLAPCPPEVLVSLGCYGQGR